MGIVVAVIPARGGSKGIPLKNLREVGFRPLIDYTISAALKAKTVDRVVVSTDSQRIADVAEKSGAAVPFLRPSNLAKDETPLAAVIVHFLNWCTDEGWDIEAIVILEPTSPLRKPEDIDNAVRIYQEKGVDTVVAVQRDTGLWWKLDHEGDPIPVQTQRLNRQYLKPMFKENGAIFVTRPEAVTESTTIGRSVALYEMGLEESIDINTWEDLRGATLAIRRQKILFHFKATAELGFGHFYRVLALANRLYYNDIVLVCSQYDESLEERIGVIGFKYHLTRNPLEVIKKEQPTILVNDILDTSEEVMKQMAKTVPMIVNFEDLGEGNQHVDLVFNALYEDSSPDSTHFGGGKYAVMREEFLFLPPYVVKDKIAVVTATFGGSDPNNIALHCIESLPSEYPDIQFRIITGPGYSHDKRLLKNRASALENTLLIDSATNMATHFSESDLVITSCGRTVFEAAACGVPCVVICQNEREMKHRHITSQDGVISMGLFSESKTMHGLLHLFEELRRDPQMRRSMSEKSTEIVDGLGIFRIIGLIERTARAKGLLRTL